MGADFFTKPLQGKLFIKLCNFIMGAAEYADGDQHNQTSVLNEIKNETTNDLKQVEPAGQHLKSETMIPRGLKYKTKIVKKRVFSGKG